MDALQAIAKILELSNQGVNDFEIQVPEPSETNPRVIGDTNFRQKLERVEIVKFCRDFTGSGLSETFQFFENGGFLLNLGNMPDVENQHKLAKLVDFLSNRGVVIR
jgi:hypothetical protein